MALETVRVAIFDNALVPALVNGVTVRVFDSAGTLVTSALSGGVEPGLVEFELPGETVPEVYQLRFYLVGASIPPQLISVYSPASLAAEGTNDFVVTAEIFTPDAASDPNLCRCSGYILGPGGRPKRGVDVVFTPKFNPFIVSGNTVLADKTIARTDATGFVSVDLYRFGMYEAVIESNDSVKRCDVVVPDRSSLLISYLLFPAVASVTYLETEPYTVAQGEDLTLTPTVRSTDFRDLGVAPDDVQYSIEDTSIASVRILSDRIVVHGIAAGATTLRVTRLDSSVLYLPELEIDGGEVSIVVT